MLERQVVHTNSFTFLDPLLNSNDSEGESFRRTLIKNAIGEIGPVDSTKILRKLEHFKSI